MTFLIILLTQIGFLPCAFASAGLSVPNITIQHAFDTGLAVFAALASILIIGKVIQIFKMVGEEKERHDVYGDDPFEERWKRWNNND